MNIGGASRSAMKWARGAMSPRGISSGMDRVAGWSHRMDSVPSELRPMIRDTTMGAMAGMLVSVPTAIADRDRSVFSSGVIGGAIWGGLAGVVGGAGSRGWRRNQLTAARAAPRGSDARTAARQSARGLLPTLLSNAKVTGAGLTGAYGLAGFMRGGSKRRKHYTQFHHGEYHNQQQQQQGGYR